MAPKRKASDSGSGEKRKSSDSGEKKEKRQKKVMTLTDKVKVLDTLKEGKSVVAMGRMFGVNESTIRSIQSKEKSIRDAVKGSAPTSAKTTHQIRDKCMTKMENALFIWLGDCHKKGIPVDTNIIRGKAKTLYNRIKAQDAAEDDPGEGPSGASGTATASQESAASTASQESTSTDEDAIFSASKG